MTRDNRVHYGSRISHDGSDGHDERRFDEDGEHPERSSGFMPMLKNAVRSWWYHHPAHVALDVARPVISRYAAEQPFKLLAISAGVGAAAVVLRPWRLVSLGGIVLAAVKTSGLSTLVLSMLTHPFIGHSTQNTGNTP